MGRILMEILNLFPTEFFVFNSNIDNYQLLTMLEKFKDVPVKRNSNISVLAELHSNEDFKPLFDWFRECLEEVRTTMKYDCDKFEIVNSWFNVSISGEQMYQNYHRHSMSFFSGVYYVTEGSPTLFEDPVMHRTQAQLEVLRKDYNPSIHLDAVPGKLVIFPSWVFHSSPTHLGSLDRYVISFNTLPTGKINYQLATDSRTFIKVKDD
jgi:uncharacterized protein (TIGR02466 family)